MATSFSMMSESEVWTPKIGVQKTIRENILLYLSQENEVKKREVRSKIGLSRERAQDHFRFLEDHG